MIFKIEAFVMTAGYSEIIQANHLDPVEFSSHME